MKNTKSKKKIVIVALMMLIALIGILFVLDYTDRQNLETVRKELNSIYSQSLEPLGAVHHSGPQTTRASAFHILECVDVSCPSMSEEWLVPIREMDKDNFAKSVMQKAGFTSNDEYGFSAVKSDFRLMLDVNPIGGFPEPSALPADESWYFVRITVYK